MPVATLKDPEKIEFDLTEVRDYKHRNSLFTRTESGYLESLSGFPKAKNVRENAPALGDLGKIVLAQGDEMLSSFLQLCSARNTKLLYDYRNTFPVAVFKDYTKRFLRGWLGDQAWHFFGYNVAFVEKNYVILFVIQFNVLQYYTLRYLSDKPEPVTAPPHKVDYIITNFKITNETSKILAEQGKDLRHFVKNIESIVESESNLASLRDLEPAPGMYFYTINLCEILDDPIAFAGFRHEARPDEPGGFYHSLYNNRLRTEQWYHELISAMRDSVTISLQDLENEISSDLMYFAYKVLNHVIDKILAEHVEYNSISFPNPNEPLDIKDINLDKIIQSAIKSDQEQYDEFYNKNSKKWSSGGDFYLKMLIDSAAKFNAKGNPMTEWAMTVKRKYDEAQKVIEQSQQATTSGSAPSLRFNFFLDYIGLEALNKAAVAWLRNSNWYTGPNATTQEARNYIEVNSGTDYFLVDVILNNSRIENMIKIAEEMPPKNT